jgi:hypothetical protein
MASGPPQLPPEHSPDPTSPVPAPNGSPAAEPDPDDMAIPPEPGTGPVWPS